MRGQPSALVLVRNTVSHDARVLREATVLRELGFSVTVAGVVSTLERERRLGIAGTDVVRLDPAGAIRTVLAALRPRRPPREDAMSVAGAEAAGGRVAVDRIAGARAAGGSAAGGNATVASATGASATGASSAGLRSRLKRLALTAGYYAQAISLVRASPPVLVHANDYNTMWIGIAAKLLCRSRLVYDCHELWADRNGRPEWRPWLIACEALFVRVADVTITTSPGYAQAIADRYRVRPPVLVRNIAATRGPLQSGGSNAAPDNAGLGVYVGGLMPGRGLEQAIQALALAPAARLRLIGPGNESYRRTLRSCAEQSGVSDRVEFAGAVPPDRVLEAIAGADFGLMLIQPACLSYQLTLPNKLFEYAAAGVPILSSDLPVIGAVVRDEGLGAVVGPTDVEAIAAGFRRLAQPDVNRERRESVRAFSARETWELEQAKLGRVYLDLVGCGRVAP